MLARLIAAGAVGFVAYKAWQRHQARMLELEPARADDQARTPPHGDPVLVGETLAVGPGPSAGIQSSRGFGEP